MAPRRGGGSSSSGGSSGSSSSSSSDDYDYDYDYSSSYNSLFGGLCAVLAFACVVLLVAVVAVVMISIKSWLRQTGSRNIPRLAIFSLLLVLTILTRALQIALLAPQIQGEGSSSAYTTLTGAASKLNVSFAYSFFDLISNIIVFVIAVIETYRGSGIVHQKFAVLEMVNYAVVAFLLIIGIAAYGEQTNIALHIYDYYYDSDYDRVYAALMAIRGLWMTFVVIGLVFVTGILVKSLATSSGESSSPSRKLYLLGFTTALWLHQLFILVIEALSLFGTSGTDAVAILGLAAVRLLLLGFIIMAIALLAWSSSSIARNSTVTTGTTASASHPPTSGAQVEKTHAIYTPNNTTGATAPVVQPPVNDFAQQRDYDSTATTRPSAGAP